MARSLNAATKSRNVCGDQCSRAYSSWAWTIRSPRPRPVRSGLGLRPDLTGRGLGERMVQAQLEYAREHWSPQTFRLFVAAFNERAISLYGRLGFREVGREMRSFPIHGE